MHQVELSGTPTHIDITGSVTLARMGGVHVCVCVCVLTSMECVRRERRATKPRPTTTFIHPFAASWREQAHDFGENLAGKIRLSTQGGNGGAGGDGGDGGNGGMGISGCKGGKGGKGTDASEFGKRSDSTWPPLSPALHCSLCPSALPSLRPSVLPYRPPSIPPVVPRPLVISSDQLLPTRGTDWRSRQRRPGGHGRWQRR